MGRIAGGVRAIKLDADDEVVAMELVEPGQELLVVTQKGASANGPRLGITRFKAAKGLLTYDKGEVQKDRRTGWAMAVDEDDDILDPIPTASSSAWRRKKSQARPRDTGA